ncbi:LacI family transcriptional regulator [Clostridium swellfunianum]|uniref:LacI family DNA-binding transcriptional regulator n=1 Tax=Clostridium swellfunianum TaxID=1367462 RepID=UPI00202E350A|nr:LacI family DNA-binding transcriptional regulator [Clostridium swellfunianum]MCM0650076.1 LacI family transcriptional regulator [Clostridium swellfunianum]
MSSIYEIAKKVGFSPSTVARALNGKGYVDERKREIILNAAKELNYAPSYAAKILKTKRTEKIIFAIPDICNPFYFDMINGANSVLEQYGYLMVLFYTKHNLNEELKVIQHLKEKYADGMIMVSFNFCHENIESINSSEAPVVLTNKYDSVDSDDKFDYVYVDTYLGIKMATEHLLKQGHQRIAYVGGDMKEQTGSERFMGYRDAILDAGLKLESKYIFESNYTESGGYLCGKEILCLEQRPTAVVASNDLMAIGIINACDEAQVKIPDDIAIIGMDNTDIATRVSPKLSSVAMLQEEIGRNAAQILMDRLNGDVGEKKRVKLFPRLVIRQSSVRQE